MNKSIHRLSCNYCKTKNNQGDGHNGDSGNREPGVAHKTLGAVFHDAIGAADAMALLLSDAIEALARNLSGLSLLDFFSFSGSFDFFFGGFCFFFV